MSLSYHFIISITCLKLFRQSTIGVSDAGSVGNMSSNVATTSSCWLIMATWMTLQGALYRITKCKIHPGGNIGEFNWQSVTFP